MMDYLYITNDINVAKILDSCGVIPWIDLEVLGKEERQKNMNTVKSQHTVDDVKRVKRILKRVPLLVRINPINSNTETEIENVIQAGADIIMLPMFENANQVKEVIGIIKKRVKVMLLFETKASVENVDEIISLSGIDYVHIGLNDLHLDYGLNFMFELFTNGTVDLLCEKFRGKDVKYGIGGIARLGIGGIPSEFVMIEHQRLGSCRAILSRSFCNVDNYNDFQKFENDFLIELKKIRDFQNVIEFVGDEFITKNHSNMKDLISTIEEGEK